MREKLVGFAAREGWLNYDDEWPLERKNTFLLKQDVTKPLSVHTRVWHLALDENSGINQPNRPGWRQNTWAQLSQLEQYLHTHSQRIPGNYWVIAITQFLDEATSEEIGIDVLPVEPNRIDAEWEFLGYDVAEMVFLSSLMNMGYSDSEKNFAQQRFGSGLNEYHLFLAQEEAMAFATWSNGRDPGHGPFYVYGLYRIKNAEGEQPKQAL